MKRAHTVPLFKHFGFLKLADKLSYCTAILMHKYRHDKLPVSFSGIFTHTLMSDELQSRHNDYYYLNEPAIKRCQENFPLKQVILNWNALDLDLKATGDKAEFENLLKEEYLSQYSFETDCLGKCYSCNAS